MRGTWTLGRCVAPVHTQGGVLRCVQARTRCTTPEHRNWDSLVPLLAVVWWLRPWWPNALGRAQDRGEAHTCPTVTPCRACASYRSQPPRRRVPRWPGPLATWQVRAYFLRNRLRKRLGLPTIWPPPYLRQRTGCGDPTCDEAHP